MDALTGAPSHVLLNRKDTDNHSTRKARQGAGGAAFQSFSYGPLDLPNAKNKDSGTDDPTGKKKPVTGAGLTGGMQNVGWLTHLSMSEHKK